MDATLNEVQTDRRAPTVVPVRKVGSGVVAANVIAVLVCLVRSFWPKIGDQITPSLAASVTTFVQFLISYVTPPDADEVTVGPQAPARPVARAWPPIRKIGVGATVGI